MSPWALFRNTRLITVDHNKKKKFLFAIWKDLPYAGAAMFKNPRNYKTSCGASYDSILSLIAYSIHTFLFPTFINEHFGKLLKEEQELLNNLVKSFPTQKGNNLMSPHLLFQCQ